MPRLPRFDHKGARHHVTNRGSRRANVFGDDLDRDRFLALLAEFPTRFGVAVHAWSLNPNHYHLLVQSVDGHLSRAMRFLGSEYTLATNRRYSWDGPLFKGRFHNRVVGYDEYWRYLLAYVHLNPVKDGFFDAVDDCPWTSHRAYLDPTKAPDWLATSEHLELFGSRPAYMAFLAAVQAGEQLAPSAFDAAQLWAPHTSMGTPPVPPIDPELALAHGLEDLELVTGLTLDELRFSPKGRRGNPAAWLAAWWLSRHCRVVQQRLAVLCDVRSATISKRIRTAIEQRETHAQLSAWMDALERLPPRSQR